MRGFDRLRELKEDPIAQANREDRQHTLQSAASKLVEIFVPIDDGRDRDEVTEAVRKVLEEIHALSVRERKRA